MVRLYVGGQQVGTLDENPDVLRKLVEAGETVEFRTEGGRGLGTFQPKTEPICPCEPELTKAEIDRRCLKPGKTLAEILERLGAE